MQHDGRKRKRAASDWYGERYNAIEGSGVIDFSTPDVIDFSAADVTIDGSDIATGVGFDVVNGTGLYATNKDNSGVAGAGQDTVIGDDAGSSSGGLVTIMGHQAGSGITAVNSRNTIIGTKSALNLTSGIRNVVIGAESDIAATAINAVAIGATSYCGGSDAIAIGQSAMASGARTIVIGESSSASFNSAIVVGDNITSTASEFVFNDVDTFRSQTTATTDLGSATHEFKDLHMSGTANVGGALDVTGAVDIGGDLAMNGTAPNLTLTAASTGQVKISLGENRTADGLSRLDFFSNSTDTNYSFQIKKLAGLNSNAEINMKGTGQIEVKAASGGVKLTTGSTAWGILSDQRFKKDIHEMKDCCMNLALLKSYRYKFKHENDSDPGRIGIIAQEVFDVFPEVCTIIPEKTDDEGTVTPEHIVVRYTELIPPLIGAVNELRREVETLKQRI